MCRKLTQNHNDLPIHMYSVSHCMILVSGELQLH
jgi:hypothetical protein